MGRNIQKWERLLSYIVYSKLKSNGNVASSSWEQQNPKSSWKIDVNFARIESR